MKDNDKSLKRYLPPPKTQDDGPLKIELPSLYDAQQRIKSEAARFNVLDIGRRAGKTYMGTHLALEYVRDGWPVGWFAPNYKYLLEVWQFLARELKPHATKINATERRIELTNGGVLECWTMDGSDDPGRSRKYKLAVIDEAAIASNLKAVWEEAIRPLLTDLRGDAWFLSTPKGLNYFYDLFQRGQDQDQFPNWKSWQLPSSVNPYLPLDEIEAARIELPEAVFKQEYLAEFLSGDGAVFRNVDACLTAQPTTPEEHKDHVKVAGVDWAKKHDFSGISIVCCTCKREVYLDRFNQIGWSFQRERILTAMHVWEVEYAYVETNSIGSPNLEAMWELLPPNRALCGFETTAKSKPKLIQSLALAFERAHLEWLPDPVARHELIAYEATVTETGYTRYGAPEGGWDDTVIMRALAWRAAKFRIPVPLADWEIEELKLSPQLRREAIAALPPEERDMAELSRFAQQSMIRRREGEKHKHWSHAEFAPDAEDEPMKTNGGVNWWQRS